MLAEKTKFTLEDVEEQFIQELPERETLLVTVIITDVLNHLSIDVDVKNNNVAVQVCAVVDLINQEFGTTLSCTVRQ